MTVPNAGDFARSVIQVLYLDITTNPQPSKLFTALTTAYEQGAADMQQACISRLSPVDGDKIRDIRRG